jgi:hypothetical protein
MQNKIIRTVQDTSNILTYLDLFPFISGYKDNHWVVVFPVRD